MYNDAAETTGNTQADASIVGPSCGCCGSKSRCLICVAAELEQVRTRDSEHIRRVVQLEGALVTSRAEAVLLRRLLALAENQRSKELVTLAQIEETCAKLGYEPDSGRPIAQWLASTLEMQR